MTSDEELRARLTEALSEFEVFAGVDGCPSIRMKDPWTDKERVEALMPVVREALAAAWDDGFDVGYADRANRDTTVPMPSNPWRQEQS